MFYRPERSEWIALARGPWYRRLGRSRAMRATVAVLCLVVLAVNSFLLTQRGKTTAVPLDETLAAFRSTNGTAAESPTTVGPITIDALAPAEVASASAPVAPALAEVEGEPAGGGAAASTPSAGEVVAAAPAAFGKPARGVYTYRATGGEKVSVLGANHDYPETVYAAVEHGQGCHWKLLTDIAREHREQRDWCSAPGSLATFGDAAQVSFFGQTENMGYRCGRGAVLIVVGAPAGTVHHASCTRDGGATAYDTTQLGQEPFTVGGTTVTAEHFRTEAAMTGNPDGHAVFEWWVDASTGLPLRIERHVTAFAKAVFGDVQYTEDATLALVSLEPRT